MRALVTGADGFVGGYLINYLLAETDLEIIGTVYKYRQLPDPVFDSKRVHLERLDLLEISAVAEVLTHYRPDYIFHLAGQAFVPLSWKNPRSTFEQNVFTLLNVFQSLLAAKLNSKILVVGSGDEYGTIEPADLPINEETRLRPVSPYGASKVTQDLLAWQYYRGHGLHTVRVRPFNHIGPGQNEVFVTSSFAKQVAGIEAGKQPPMLRHGNLETKRDFTDVKDIVRAYWLILNHGQPGEVYNVGSGQAVSIQQILNILLSFAKTPITLEADPDRMRPSDTPVFISDCTRLKQATGWEPQIPLEQTLYDILVDWRERI